MKWLRLRNILAVLAAVFTISNALPAGAGTITMASTTWVGWGPIFLARDLGYYKAMGLTVNFPIVSETSEAFTTMAAGKADAVGDTFDDMLAYRSKNVCFKAVAVLDDSYGGDGLLVQKDVHTLAQLKGKTVALNEDSVSSFWLQYLLRKQGMSNKDVHIVNMSADEAAVAFMANKVPAAVTWEPSLTLATTKGSGKVLVDSKTTPGVIADALIVTCSVLEKQPQDVKNMIKGYYMALDYIKAHPAQANQMMAKSIGGWLSKPEDVTAAMSHVRFYNRAANLAYFGTEAKPGPVGGLIAQGNDIWSQLGHLKSPVAVNDVVDWRFNGE